MAPDTRRRARASPPPPTHKRTTGRTGKVMAQATLGLVLLVAAGLLIVAVPRISNSTGKAVAVRLAAIGFVGAGINLTAGWVGSAAGWLTTTANDIGSTMISAGFGSSAVWVLWMALAIVWVAGMVPETWFAFQIPDWLSFSGVLLPALTAGLPGSLGHGLHRLIITLGSTMARVVSGWFA